MAIATGHDRLRIALDLASRMDGALATFDGGAPIVTGVAFSTV